MFMSVQLSTILEFTQAITVHTWTCHLSGRHGVRSEERDGLIDLMLDFIEAMNENIKFSRNFMVLKDRDLTGELKDIWAVIQAKRDAEKIHPSQTLRDENSHPCSPQTACTPQNAKHKRSDEEGECMEASEACCQDEAASLQSEARGDS
ncbi:hypothetical protein J6590_095188 [Homalodisca vitripennis]|nr:hypothetical protein J6590_095188 [Homalodisca vitripennis]